MCASSYCSKCKVTFLWGVRYFAFTGGKSMDAGNYCRRADSPQALTLVTCSCAHEIRENSSHLQPGTWSKLATEVPSIVNGNREAPSGSSHLSRWDFHPFWSQVFRKSWALQLPTCSRDNTRTVPSQRWHLWHTFLCAAPSFVVNLQSTWNTQHATWCAPMSVSSSQQAHLQFLQELPWGICLFLLTVEGHQRQPWLSGAVPPWRWGNEGWQLVAWMLWADTNELLMWD